MCLLSIHPCPYPIDEPCQSGHPQALTAGNVSEVLIRLIREYVAGDKAPDRADEKSEGRREA